MKKNKKGIDLLSIVLNLIIISIIAILAVFIYYCLENGAENVISEFADDIKMAEIRLLESTTNVESNIQNPLNSIAEVSNEVYTQIESTNRYYYNQIDDNAKIIYNALISNKENLKSGSYTIEFDKKFNTLLNSEGGTELLNNSYQQALDAFLLDNPDVFYIDISKMCLMIYSRKTILKTTHTVSIKSEANGTYYIDEFKDKQQIEQSYTVLENIKTDLISKLTGNTYDKVKQVHDCLVNSLEYDQTISKSNIRNIYGGLVSKEVVCEGYAKSFKYILDDLRIPNIIVVGTATNSSNQTETHAWNYVYIDENWYAVDVTWDDPIIVGGKLPKSEKYKYFLKGSKTFNVNHVVTGTVSENGKKFIYPELSLEDY